MGYNLTMNMTVSLQTILEQSPRYLQLLQKQLELTILGFFFTCLYYLNNVNDFIINRSYIVAFSLFNFDILKLTAHGHALF